MSRLNVEVSSSAVKRPFVDGWRLRKVVSGGRDGGSHGDDRDGTGPSLQKLRQFGATAEAATPDCSAALTGVVPSGDWLADGERRVEFDLGCWCGRWYRLRVDDYRLDDDLGLDGDLALDDDDFRFSGDDTFDDDDFRLGGDDAFDDYRLDDCHLSFDDDNRGFGGHDAAQRGLSARRSGV